MTVDYKFEGWLGKSSDSAGGKMEWGEYEPKQWTEYDVDIQISHCGMCGSDLHVLGSEWGATDYPCCVGHEIVGKVVKAGNNVGHLSVGDRVGVGSQAGSCQRPSCPECSTCKQNYCSEFVMTYGAAWPNGEGKAMGGYANYYRGNAAFAFKIPEGLRSEYAAPMLCAGITVYSPLRHHNCGPGKTVAVIGVGGLGHFAVLFAKALGADRVVGVSRKSSKRDEVLKLGADDYVATDDEQDWATKYARSFDLIVNTVSSSKMPLDGYISLLKVEGTLIQVGNPDGGMLPSISAFGLLAAGRQIAGSGCGSPARINEMLQLAAEKNIKPWIEMRPLEDANQALIDLEDGKPRFRYVLVNKENL
ncbi:hypothetical protein FOYG_03933 [Fusarium oxysporum NRRL 32931]|uniref:alcohol dehydrogenase (NADP(+)) n=1 Tax=Fusarium oxysporum NRRL 32931 TaxID=660029 RepID=W9J359_FUSOX|nr:hypothetical protein FOYG_03933 [Fusarium oxysporum NRRL 32931]